MGCAGSKAASTNHEEAFSNQRHGTAGAKLSIVLHLIADKQLRNSGVVFNGV